MVSTVGFSVGVLYVVCYGMGLYGLVSLWLTIGVEVYYVLCTLHFVLLYFVHWQTGSCTLVRPESACLL